MKKGGGVFLGTDKRGWLYNFLVKVWECTSVLVISIMSLVILMRNMKVMEGRGGGNWGGGKRT